VRHFKTSIFLITIVAIALAAILLGRVDLTQLQGWLQSTGGWAPVLYMLLYTIATVLVLPSTR